MPEKKDNTAILVFIRDPKHEAEEKVFADHIGFRGNQKLAEKLNQRIIKLSRESRIPSFVFDSSKQHGLTFGERFTNAFEAIFAKGFEKVIAVGNDCLSLNEKTLLRAESALRKNELVLGPTLDGGFYLIGVSKKIFKADTFKNFNWTTNRLVNDFEAFVLNNNLLVTYFESAIDIDNQNDLKRALASLPKIYSLRMAIEAIIFYIIRQFLKHSSSFLNPYLHRFSLLRAPPIS